MTPEQYTAYKIYDIKIGLLVMFVLLIILGVIKLINKHRGVEQ